MDERGFVSLPTTGKHVLKIAIRVKKLVDDAVPVQFPESALAAHDSRVLNDRVFDLLLRAAGGKGDGAQGTSSRKYRATLIFVLLIVTRWNKKCAVNMLYDQELYDTRALAAQYLAKRILETEDDEYYMFKDMLCQRYTITLHGRDVPAMNALEVAVDLHSTIVIGSSGFQRCIKWIWNGWIVQSDENPAEYVYYKYIDDPRFSVHFNPDRIKSPKFQNYLQLLVSIVYLVLYTVAINGGRQSASLAAIEVWFYIFTFSFIVDEVQKLAHVGANYLGFWNAFNDTLYGIIVVTFGFRVAALTATSQEARDSYDLAAYHLLSCAAPMIWGRLLLYLDSIRFFGAMLVVLKELMKESIIFFVLFAIICGGFLQAFVGLDTADGQRDVSSLLVRIMTKTVLDAPEFEWMDSFAPPYGEVLYYVFTFMISTILLNILIALFNSAYEKIYDNATDEYMALVAQKTLRFVRAPDENVFIPPLNLVEIVCLIVPFSWWLDPSLYEKLAVSAMTIIYSPFLLIIAIQEARAARRVLYNRSKGVEDDANENDEEWDLLDGYYDNEEERRAHPYGGELEQMEQAIASGDPEFHIDEKKWSNEVQAATVTVNSRGIAPSAHRELELKIQELTELVQKFINQTPAAGSNSS
jgi:hypothetical protein